MSLPITTNQYLNFARVYGNALSGCTKVKVGALIVNAAGHMVSFGANRCYPDLCTTRGCLRIEKYGDNHKEHRNPSDCRSIHSEIDAISSAKADLTGATIYVTRYPCETCARAICAAGITRVVYGRTQEISDETKRIFESNNVLIHWIKDWIEEDTEE